LFSYSDYVLVPTKAGFFDIMAIKSTLALIKFSQGQNQRLKAGIVLNMLKPRSGITAEVVELINSLGTPLLSDERPSEDTPGNSPNY
jgi:chromosome partitioning protein